MMWEKIKKFRLWVVEQVLWAEHTLTGLNGKGKRDAVVKKLDDMIRLPVYLEPLDGPIIGFFVDMAVEKLNGAFGHSFGVEPITQAQERESADSIEVSEEEAECMKDMAFTEPEKAPDPSGD